jgi:hypothetical protein
MNLRQALAALVAWCALVTGLQAGPPVVVVAPRSTTVVNFGPRVYGPVVYGGYAPVYPAPFAYGGGYYSSSVTIIGASPPPSSSPRITINVNVNTGQAPADVAPIADVKDEDFPDKIVVRPRKPQGVREAALVKPAAPPPDAPLPGQPAGNFRPIRPEDRVPPANPVVPPPVEDELGRLMRLGTEAFANQEYGTAEKRFEQATRQAPKEAAAHFYLAQACFALGKYQEAVAELHAGLRLDANWPSSRFRARELYGPNDAAFADHFKELEAARAAAPNDPVLLFLSAYEMWFDNRQEESRPLFRRAARLVAEPRFMDLFLLAQPGGAVAAR